MKINILTSMYVLKAYCGHPSNMSTALRFSQKENPVPRVITPILPTTPVPHLENDTATLELRMIKENDRPIAELIQ